MSTQFTGYPVAGGRSARLREFEVWADRTSRWSGPVLVIGGSSRIRESFARLLHREWVRPGGAFRCVDGSSPVPATSFSILRHPDSPAAGGTLFVDPVDRLRLPDQRRLLAWLDARDVRTGSLGAPWRLVAGLDAPFGELSGAHRLLPALLDSLDKWRIDLR
ncbi:MAG: hypothetical protein HZB25_08085 [Candidatus Eisenbacteria bacterium]|nr:hypothetical protein [Candidatus Eisenbacteria bacterium]